MLLNQLAREQHEPEFLQRLMSNLTTEFQHILEFEEQFMSLNCHMQEDLSPQLLKLKSCFYNLGAYSAGAAVERLNKNLILNGGIGFDKVDVEFIEEHSSFVMVTAETAQLWYNLKEVALESMDQLEKWMTLMNERAADEVQQ